MAKAITELTPQLIGVDLNHTTQCTFCRNNATHSWYHPEEVEASYTCTDHYNFVLVTVKPITDAWWAQQYATS